MSELHSHSQPHTRNSVTGDVRAGPGDAGATDRPEQLPRTDQDRKRARAAGPFTVAVVLTGIVLVVLFWAIF